MSKEEVKDILEASKEAVANADIPPELQEVAFSKAFDLLARERMGPQEPRMEQPADTPTAVRRPPESESVLTRIAARLRVGQEAVESVFHAEGNGFDILVPGSRLDRTKSGATKQLALLITAARQGAELEEWTDADEIRHFAEEFKRYDSANYASSIKELSDVLLIRQSGRKILVKLSRPGWERAAELVRRLSGEE